MKKLIPAGLLILVLALAQANANLLVNGSFVSDVSGWTETLLYTDGSGWSGWYTPGYANGGFLVTRIFPGCYSHDYCVGNYYTYWSQTVFLSPGSHTLSFAYYSQHALWSFAVLHVVLVNASSVEVNLFSTTGTNGLWQTRSIDISGHIDLPGSYEIRLVFDVGNDYGASAEGGFDEVVLT